MKSSFYCFAYCFSGRCAGREPFSSGPPASLLGQPYHVHMGKTSLANGGPYSFFAYFSNSQKIIIEQKVNMILRDYVYIDHFPCAVFVQ
jgi:hypothetical protein